MQLLVPRKILCLPARAKLLPARASFLRTSKVCYLHMQDITCTCNIFIILFARATLAGSICAHVDLTVARATEFSLERPIFARAHLARAKKFLHLQKKMPRLCLCKFVARKLGFARHHFHLIIVFSRKSFTMIHKAKPNAVKPRPRVSPMQ